MMRTFQLLFALAAVTGCTCRDETVSPSPLSSPLSSPLPAGSGIVSLSPACTQQLYLLGVQERLVGTTIYCERPAAAKAKPKVGTLTSANVEAIARLRPQLVLATTLTPPRQQAMLQHLGIRVEEVKDPVSFAGLCDQFERLGQAVGKADLARRIVAEAQRSVAAIRAATAPLTPRRVFVQIGIRPLFTVTEQSFINDLIVLAGGQNVASRSGEGIYSREQVVADNPEVILISSMGVDGAAERAAWSAYPTIAAVRNQEIHVIDSYELCSPTPPVFVETLRKVANFIHNIEKNN